MVQRPLKTEGTEEVEERKKDLATQVEGGRIHYMSSLFIEKIHN